MAWGTRLVPLGVDGFGRERAVMLPLIAQIHSAGLPEPETEVSFHRKRKWRFDLAYPDILLAIEVEGGTWSGGRHVRGKGYEEDARKYNEAALAGWTVLRFTTDMVRTGEALTLIERAFAMRRRENESL
jgi:hypothetical protein